MAKGVHRYPHAEKATQYARDIVRGRIDACRYVKLACQRHLNDLQRQKDSAWPYRWDKAKAEWACRFIELMVHVKGQWAGKPIEMQPWQCFTVAVPFGWVRKTDGLRRFREIYEEEPRKNAKSTKAAGIGNYMCFGEGEPGAEVYSGATTLEQAMFVFKTAWLMVDKNPEFKRAMSLELGGTQKNPGPVVRVSDASKFMAIVGKPGDGASPHCAIVDEYHEHASSEQRDAMKTGMGSRREPMLMTITTAGTDTSGPCYQEHLRAIKVLEGTIKDEQLFAIIYTIDDGDDWKDFGCWRKANPNFGVSVFEDYLRGQYSEAMQSAAKQNIILTKHLNIWTNAGKAWMNMAKWSACARPQLKLADFAGRRAWLGLDLASKVDIADLVVLIDAGDNDFVVFSRHYLPSETVDLPHNGHYRQWRDQGFLTVTEGARTDFHRIEEDIRELAELLDVQELDFDPREASYLIQQVQAWAGFECVEIPQAAAHMSEPMKELEAMIYEGALLSDWSPGSGAARPDLGNGFQPVLFHSDDPVANWMMGNVVLKQTRLGPVKYYYPTKTSNDAKIDFAVALIMAVKRARTIDIGGVIHQAVVTWEDRA